MHGPYIQVLLRRKIVSLQIELQQSESKRLASERELQYWRAVASGVSVEQAQQQMDQAAVADAATMAAAAAADTAAAAADTSATACGDAEMDDEADEDDPSGDFSF